MPGATLLTEMPVLARFDWLCTWLIVGQNRTQILKTPDFFCDKTH